MGNQNYKFCSNCGAKLSMENKFCVNCGKAQTNSEETYQKELENGNDTNKETVKSKADEYNYINTKNDTIATRDYSSQIQYLNLKNSERKKMKKCYFTSFLGFLMIIAPSIFNIDGMKGGYALSLIGMLIMISLFLVGLLVFKDRAKVFDSIMAGENIIAYWKYGTKEWKKFKDDEYNEIKSTNKGMYIFMIILCSIIFLPFIIFSREGFAMGIVLICLIGILGIAAFLGTKLAKNKENEGFVIIARDGILTNKKFDCWKGFGVKFEEAGYCSEDPSMLEINYKASYYRHHHMIQTVIVLIPKGKELMAEEVIDELMRYHYRS